MGQLPISVPNAALFLLDYIGLREGPSGYVTIFGNNQKRLPKQITEMTLDEVIANQRNWTKRYGSSAAGRYQFMRATLTSIKKECALTGKEIFEADFQDRCGYFLLLRRDFQDFIDGHLSITAFGKRLAQEWASFPVLENTRGAHRNVLRGQSYYAGDGVNKALYHPSEVEGKLSSVLKLAKTSPLRPNTSTVEPPEKAVKTVAPEQKPALPEKVQAQKLDKPLAKSKTVWMWLASAGGSIGSALAAFSGMDWRVQLLLVAVICGFAVYAIKRRADLKNLISEVTGNA
jgi:muramidase (phage lysozyme)